MSRIHRGQLYVRGGWQDGDKSLCAVVGVAEVDPDTDEHLIHGYAAQRMADGVILSATGHSAHADTGDLYSCEIDRLLTGQEWPRPSNGLAGGGLMLRHTRAPAAEARSLALICGLFSSNGPLLEDQTTVDIAGDMGRSLAVTSVRCARHWKTMGKSLCQIVKEPRWGWGDEPWGVNSTMSLVSIDEAQAYQDLLDNPNATKEQLERDRRAGTGGASAVATDPYDNGQYAAFRKRMIAEVGPLRWDGVQTLSDRARRDEIARRIIVDLKLAA